MKALISVLAFSIFPISMSAQVTLKADGPGNTYELINSVLAPGYDAVEVPDCNHADFGPHITEEFDKDLKENVFVFHIHVSPDNDRCKKDDRQRNEIKTFESSPANLKAVSGETVTYKWKFKLDGKFQTSTKFTHIHQIKAVGGTEDKIPTITFTLRKGNPDKFELRYASNMEQETLSKVDLALFKGEWVEVTETITFGESGKYAVSIKKVKGDKEIFSYTNNKLRMWKTEADFLRPKWGIYRSLGDATNLRDEQVRYADFSISEDVSVE